MNTYSQNPPLSREAQLWNRLVRVERLQVKDANRFKPNPLGAGFLTRNERYLEVIWEIRRQIEAEKAVRRERIRIECEKPVPYGC
jgi:hypothetical protein